ncbi:MmgE/PrpD family protein [Cupriavidus basilensis]|uniref:MmgE/PrpD family protein n=1 Tax=Cupriavidus basilensis TaxID=68895 RepID=UPI000750B6A0|nr:MmgE/PrpD family protein [Cupriavidus basilensis]
MSTSTTDDTLIPGLGESVAGFATRTFSPAVREKAKACLLDALGLAQIARDEATTLAMRDATTALPPDAASPRLWPYGIRAVLSEAVTANAVAVHAHFHDDSDPHSWCHPGSLITPVAVGVAEATGASVERAVRGLIAGYTVLNWLGDHEHVAHALIQRGVRTSPALGTIGAAAAASVVLGLSAARTANALAIAASITGGTLAPLRCGSDEWRAQNAQAARGGLLAAQLAQRDVVGARTALAGPKGLLQALAGLDAVPPGWTLPLRDDAMLDIYAKPWATLGDNMAAVRAARLMHDEGIDTSRITRIEIRIWRAYAEYPGTQYKGPFDLPVQALASTAFATAAMLVLGDLEYDVSLHRRHDPALLALVGKTQIVPSDEGTKLDAVLTVHFEDGTSRVCHAADAPRTWLYHDAATSTRIFGQRLARCGRQPGTGEAIGATLFSDAADAMPMAQLLDRIIPA